MFRLWARTFRNTHVLQNLCVEDPSEDTRTHKVFHALEKTVLEFDLCTPIWLDKNISEFRRHAKTRFTQDNFIEPISFDFLEIQVIEED